MFETLIFDARTEISVTGINEKMIFVFKLMSNMNQIINPICDHIHELSVNCWVQDEITNKLFFFNTNMLKRILQSRFKSCNLILYFFS